MQKIFVNKKIELANTLPSEFYTYEKFYNLSKEKIFLKSWQWIDSNEINNKNKIIIPINILEDLINEPVILLKDNNKDYTFHRYDGAGHGFMYYQTPLYRQQQSMDAWEKIFDFYEDKLRS